MASMNTWMAPGDWCGDPSLFMVMAVTAARGRRQLLDVVLSWPGSLSDVLITPSILDPGIVSRDLWSCPALVTRAQHLNNPQHADTA